MRCEDCQIALQELFSEDEARVLVDHKPMTDRYHRAYEYLEDLIYRGDAVGLKVRDDGDVELAIFCESSASENEEPVCGEYGVFRIKVAVFNDVVFADRAKLVSFYDNKSNKTDSGNKAIYTKEEAVTLMKSYAGYQTCEE